MATAGLAKDTYDSMNVVQQFRDHIDQMREDSSAAATMALESAQAGRLDSPQRLQKLIDQTKSMSTALEDLDKKSKQLEETATKKRKELEQAASSLMTQHSRFALGHEGANGASHALEDKSTVDVVEGTVVANDDRKPTFTR